MTDKYRHTTGFPEKFTFQGDHQIFTEISTALHDFAKKQTIKGGFTRLELLLARVRENPEFDALEFDRFLAGLIQDDDVANGDFAMGIVLIAEKTGCHGNNLRNAIEQGLSGDNNVLSARSQFEMSKLLIKCGGEFTPVQLNRLTGLKTEIPELWLDLALEAYSSDSQGLLDEIGTLLLDKAHPLQWQTLKSRYLKLDEVVPDHHFNNFVLKLADHLSSGDRGEFLGWIDNQRGTGLSC